MSGIPRTHAINRAASVRFAQTCACVRGDGWRGAVAVQGPRRPLRRVPSTAHAHVTVHVNRGSRTPAASPPPASHGGRSLPQARTGRASAARLSDTVSPGSKLNSGGASSAALSRPLRRALLLSAVGVPRDRGGREPIRRGQAGAISVRTRRGLEGRRRVGGCEAPRAGSGGAGGPGDCAAGSRLCDADPVGQSWAIGRVGAAGETRRRAVHADVRVRVRGDGWRGRG
jgi:hypothetical protein